MDRGCHNHIQRLGSHQRPWSNLLRKVAGCCGQSCGLSLRCKRDFLAFEWKKACWNLYLWEELGTPDLECLAMFPNPDLDFPPVSRLLGHNWVCPSLSYHTPSWLCIDQTCNLFLARWQSYEITTRKAYSKAWRRDCQLMILSICLLSAPWFCSTRS